MLMEAQVTFPNPHNHSGVSEKDLIPPSADTEEACGGHVLKSNETTEENSTCLHSAGVVTFKSVQKVQQSSSVENDDSKPFFF